MNMTEATQMTIYAITFMLFNTICFLAGLALGWNEARNAYREIVQELYDNLRDVPERMRNVTIKEAIKAEFTAATMELTPLPHSMQTPQREQNPAQKSTQIYKI